MLDRFLDLQADKIERVLEAHHAPTRVWGGHVTSHAVHFQLAPAPKTRSTYLRGLTDQIAAALNVSSAQLTRNRGRLFVQVPNASPRALSFMELNARLEADHDLQRALAVTGTAILGMDGEGVPLLLRLSSPDVAHCLIAGLPGSGKTELVRTIVTSLVLHSKPRELQLALFDPQGTNLAPFAALPHLLFPATRQLAWLMERMHWLVDEMERRAREQIAHPRIVIVMDELADLMLICGSELENLVARLVQEGRQAGMSLVACTEELTRGDQLAHAAWAGWPIKIVGRVASAEVADLFTGIEGSKAEQFEDPGDFVVVVKGEAIHFTSAYVSPEEWHRLSPRMVGQCRAGKIIPFKRFQI